LFSLHHLLLLVQVDVTSGNKFSLILGVYQVKYLDQAILKSTDHDITRIT